MPNYLHATIFVLAGFTVITSPGTADAIVFDDFSVGPLEFSSANNADSHILQTNLDPTHVAGGTRFVDFFFVGPAPGNSMKIDTVASELRLNAGLQCCTEMSVSYGSSSVPLHLDLTADGSDRMLFTFAQINLALAYQIPSFSLFDAQGHEVQPLRNATLPPNPQAGFSLTVPFAQLPGINFADIGSLVLDIGRYPGSTSFALDDIRTVPEPATFSLLLIYLTAAMFSRRNCGDRNRNICR
jgi:hypothetical protein